jgi:hypothetical protein
MGLSNREKNVEFRKATFEKSKHLLFIKVEMATGRNSEKEGIAEKSFKVEKQTLNSCLKEKKIEMMQKILLQATHHQIMYENYDQFPQNVSDYLDIQSNYIN